MILERLKLFFIFSVMLYSQSTYASLVDTSPTMKYTTGHVGAVGLVTDANDNPILAEFGSDGLMVRELGPYGVGDFKNVTILSASAWRAMQDLLTTYLSEHGENGDRLAVGATLMSVAQYNSLKLVTNTRDSVEVTKPVLKDQNSKSVLLIAEQKILTPHPPYEAVVLMEFPVDLSTNTTLANDTVSLVVNDQGQIVLQSQYDVSYKVEYYKDKEAENGFDRLWAPVNGMSLYGVFGSGASFPDGKYTVIEVWPSCPKFSYTYDAPLTAKVYYSNFNPKTPSGGSHYIPIVKNGYVFCSNISGNLQGATDLTAQMVGTSTSSIEGSAKLSANKSEADFQIPVMELLAIGQLENVELGSVTEYQSDDTAIPVLANGGYRFDFDGDGKTDLVVSSPTDANKVDIYLGGRTEYNELDIRNPPDLTRLADSVLTPQLQHQGLLKTITKEDLEDTDIYIYREATGQLLSAVEGLSGKADDIFIGDSGNVGGEGSEADFSFTTLIVSQGNGGAFINEDERFNKAAQASPWKTSAGIGAGFKDGGQDFLRVGETVNIIAINRKTGYIGSKKTRLTSLNAGDMGTINDIVLRPPNLKVIATRTFEDTAGLTKGEQHNNQLIGSEGAGLTSDDYVKIQTVWLAEDGSVLPETLPGYTGRLAVSTGNSTKDFSGNFEIKPGYQTQVVQLNNAAELTTEHFYVQVIGENFDGNPSFESPGAGPGKLQTRPAKYVPIKVPVFNELDTLDAQNALRDAKQEGIKDLPDEVAPVYHWVYRPEMQFSVFDWNVQQLFITDENDISIDILNEDRPGIYEGNSIDVFATLLGSTIDELTRFSDDRELILSVGGQEIKINTGENQQITFPDTEFLSNLAYEDYLTISLLQNNDSGNILWQFGFVINGLHVYYQIPHELEELKPLEAMIGSKQRVRTLGGMRLRYEYHPPINTEITKVTWTFQHDGYYCKQSGADNKNAAEQCEPVKAGDHYEQTASKTDIGNCNIFKCGIWWEPVDSSSNVLWQADLDIKDNKYIAETKPTTLYNPEADNRTERTAEFDVIAREIGPNMTDPKGNDIVLLEAFLRQIGMSPNSSPGSYNKTPLSKSKSKIFETTTPSVGRMLGRFNYISSGPLDFTISKMNTKDDSTYKPMKELERHWKHYIKAYAKWNSHQTIPFTNVPTANAVKVFDGTISYVSAGGVPTDSIPATYTETKHGKVKTMTGATFERSDILKAMAQMESYGKQWDNWKMIVGESDEAGSKGFNQLLNRYTYGALAQDSKQVVIRDGKTIPKTSLLISAYDSAGTSNINHYDAEQNIIAKAVWLSLADNKGGGGAFYRAFAAPDSVRNYRGKYTSPTGTPLKKYKHDGAADVLVTDGKHNDDSYELLAKGLGAYNQGVASFSKGEGNAWLSSLVNQMTIQSTEYIAIVDILSKKKIPSDLQKKSFARTKAMKYAMDIMHQSSKLGLKYRTYIWQGGATPAATITDPVTGVVTVIRPAQDWCFAYGEREWIDGKKWVDALRDAGANKPGTRLSTCP